MQIEVPIQCSTKVFLVDDVDLPLVTGVKWYLNKKTGYVYRYSTGDNHKLLHRLICNVTETKVHVDHKDRNKLNCTRDNLRVCTNQANSRNRAKRAGVTSRFKGVSWEKRVKKWRATIFLNYRQIHLGTFVKEEDAAIAYNHKATELFGEFALLNEVA